MDEIIKLKLLTLGEDQFENLCVELLPLVDPSYAGIEPNMSSLGKTRGGTPDAFVALPDGRYVAFQFTARQDRLEAKVKGDLRKLDEDACPFKGKVAKVVVCLTTNVGSEFETYQQECRARGWELDFFSLQRMVSCLETQDELCEKYLRIPGPARPAPAAAPPPDVSYFDCGGRLAEIRRELKLRPSEFTELIGCPSEKRYVRIEEGEEEAPSDLIDRAAARTGASVAWIRHGSGQRYPVEELYYSNPSAAVERLAELAPRTLFVTLDLEQFHLCGAAQLDAFKWLPLDFGCQMHFWTWEGDGEKILDAVRLLELLDSRFGHIIRGRVLPIADQEKLMRGEAHPGTLLKTGYDQYNLWVEQIVDLRREMRPAEHYRASYGEWFVKIQDCFRYVRRIV